MIGGLWIKKNSDCNRAVLTPRGEHTLPHPCLGDTNGEGVFVLCPPLASPQIPQGQKSVPACEQAGGNPLMKGTVELSCW